MSAYGAATAPEYLAATASTQTCDCGLDIDEFGDHRPAADACETCGHRLDYCAHGERDAMLDAQERLDAATIDEIDRDLRALEP